MIIQEPTRFQIRRLRVYEIGCGVFLFLLVFGILLVYRMGSSMDWLPVESEVSGTYLPEINQLQLTDGSSWLLWVNSHLGTVTACDLNHPGHNVTLLPPPYLSIHPVDVIGGDLLCLITTPQTSLIENLRQGWRTLLEIWWGGAEGEITPRHTTEADFTESPYATVDRRRLLKRKSITRLERISLSTGRIQSSFSGGAIGTDVSRKGAEDTSLTHFETGRLALSADHLNLAWWRAREEPEATLLSATVTEQLAILSVGPKLRLLFVNEFSSEGTLSIRSRLLQKVGQPIWVVHDQCVFLSFYDSGSLIPFDCEQGTPQAAIPIQTLQQTIHEGAPEVAYDPEEVLYLTSGEVLTWSRIQVPKGGEMGKTPSGETVHLCLLDPQYRLIHHARLESTDYDFSQVIWLTHRQQLLLMGKNHQLCSLSPKGERLATFSIPPDWGDGFQLLGEDRSGNLIGYDQGIFYILRGAGEAWEILDLGR